MDRYELTRELCKDKDVLDIGCAGDLDNHLKNTDKWAFSRAMVVAKSILGIDCDEEKIKQLYKEGYPVRLGRAEDFYTGRRFDIVMAQELIEHLDNPGVFLKNVKKALREDGFLILSTPNVMVLYAAAGKGSSATF